MILSGILGGIIDSLGGTKVWLVAPTCCVLRMPTAESITTARVSDLMILSPPQAFPPQACLASVGNLDVS